VKTPELLPNVHQSAIWKGSAAASEKAWLSQEKIGGALGLHWTYIGRIERGKQNISLANVGKIARALKITVEKMFKVFVEELCRVRLHW